MKLSAMIGTFVGWKLASLTVLLSFLAVFLIMGFVKGRRDSIQFGPYLAAAAVVSLLWGGWLLRWMFGA
jgi:leader peptidase (prepilin peptidase) / N-methyltransferase